MANERILIAEDEAELAEIVRDYLLAEGFEVRLAPDGQEAWKVFQEFQPQLLILDIMLPRIDGMEICRRVRAQSSVPILMFSSRSSDLDKILGLGLGADDYMTKPFSPMELVARVKAQLRRYIHMSAPVPAPSGVLTFGELTIDDKAYAVTVGGREAVLAAKEFELLSYMAHHPFQVFTREQLFNQIWGFDEYGDINTVTVHIRKIREKIEKDPSDPVYVKTVWGVGYKFDGGRK